MGIRSREDYLRYLEADRRALGRDAPRPRLVGDEVWRFLRLLRAVEYWEACQRAWYHRPVRSLLSVRFHLASVRLGFTIPPHVFGPGLALPDRGTIVVNSCARVGANCRLFTCVNIGTSAGAETEAPTIGDNVSIGQGTVMFGRIAIADGITILPKSVVNRSFDEPGITIGGRPAREVSAIGMTGSDEDPMRPPAAASPDPAGVANGDRGPHPGDAAPTPTKSLTETS